MGNKTLLIIPAYNEEKNIRNVVLKSMKYVDVCVINDCSTDKTLQILESINGVHIINHRVNTHMAGALIDGMKYAYDCGYEYCISMDAGLSFNPDHINRFINHNHCDLILCNRVKKYNTPLSRRILSLTANFIYNLSIKTFLQFITTKYYSDISANFRKYSRQSIKLILLSDINSRSYDFMYETARIIYKNKLSISEIPVTYHYSNTSLNKQVIFDCIKSVVTNLFH